ncbi:nitrate reductase subunit alpha [Actinobacillus delphinicola]|uniref:nitrate reductase (quinone) n=1 Tax=Actinobacillus delphinicola TaxID=51161 RepID=A0A448TV26_9PAST|nr:nitrate reductase subunit alpha [Actinobacillus delphinicola]VEJ09785.1 anaerobic dimethyl sulfoxide reductase subunit A [Actinobacillus delphinicola]
MGQFLDNLLFFKRKKEEFSNGFGETRQESREWEHAYRTRWQQDKIVRSTHGVNCTGSCSWKIYVKNGLVTWETQQTDYPRTRPDLPNHEPRGCPRGASYSWYLYSANRVKYPKVRGALLKLWREAKKQYKDPVDAWRSIVSDPEKAKLYKSQRGLGGFVRSSWDEVNEIIAAANVSTIKEYGPDRIVGFSPIPAMSMVSWAAGGRFLSLIGGVCLSFYDWYCDLPPASPQTWGEQTDVPESADWYNSHYIITWGSNVPLTRTPDAHFLSEVRYKGTKVVAITPDYAEVSKFGDEWMNPQQGTDAAVAMAMGHCILKEWYIDKQSDYFTDYVRRYTDFPMLVMLEENSKGDLVPGRYLRASDLVALKDDENSEWKTIAIDELTGDFVSPQGSVGYRWSEHKGQWNLEEKEGHAGKDTKLALSLKGNDTINVAFSHFAAVSKGQFWKNDGNDEVLHRLVPYKTIQLADGSQAKIVTVFDLILANYGVDNVGGDNVAKDFYDDVPGTPAWQEKLTGVSAEQVIRIAHEFAETAHKTKGKSMIIIGAGVNHWYHTDMVYRGAINMLMMCGCIGQSGGGWSHYVGQEKLRPLTGWTPIALATDWQRPPRLMNGTSFFYNHSSQWRHEKFDIHNIISPLANADNAYSHMLDYNVTAERMGWLPSAPQLNTNPLTIARKAKEEGLSSKEYIVKHLKDGSLRFACESPDDPKNFPRNLFIWRSNLFGSSGKGAEYMLKYLLGTKNAAVLNKDGTMKPTQVDWVEDAPTGKLDLVTVLDFRMSTTCVYSDIVLPTASWYEKEDINTSDMHPFIHPFSAAVDPCWEARSDWEIYKGFAKGVSDLSPGHLGEETDIVAQPMLHDTPAEMGQPLGIKDWKKGECDIIPGKTAPDFIEVKRDYRDIYKKYTSLGPLLDKLGNGGKGIHWKTEKEVELLAKLHRTVQEDGVSQGRPNLNTAVQACDSVMSLAPETNGEVAVRAWAALSESTGRDLTHLAKPKEEIKIRYNDIVSQPRKIISSPIWSGLEDEHVSYNAGYTNVHELIPWRTITGRQQFYQDHQWMRLFGEQMVSYRPPINTQSADKIFESKPNGNKEIKLNFATPHQKWGIHSTYSDNLLMLTLGRGGPHVWISEKDAKRADIEDNDWVEVFNENGAITCRAVVSQRVIEGMLIMYHAQERIVNVPGSEMTGTRGGIHNSATRAILKPTHMIGGYAQQSYGYNYYGTIGCNRDEIAVIRKMNKVDWLDNAGNDLPQPLATDVDYK